MASPTQWIWIWVDSGSCWQTGRRGMLQFMGLQRVGHDWVTELNHYCKIYYWKVLQFCSLDYLGYFAPLLIHMHFRMYTHTYTHTHTHTHTHTELMGLIGVSLTADQLWGNLHLYNIHLTNPWAGYSSPFIQVFFNSSHLYNLYLEFLQIYLLIELFFKISFKIVSRNTINFWTLMASRNLVIST